MAEQQAREHLSRLVKRLSTAKAHAAAAADVAAWSMNVVDRIQDELDDFARAGHRSQLLQSASASSVAPPGTPGPTRERSRLPPPRPRQLPVQQSPLVILNAVVNELWTTAPRPHEDGLWASHLHAQLSGMPGMPSGRGSLKKFIAALQAAPGNQVQLLIDFEEGGLCVSDVAVRLRR